MSESLINNQEHQPSLIGYEGIDAVLTAPNYSRLASLEELIAQDDMRDVKPIGAAALYALYEPQHVIGGGSFWMTHER